MAPSSNLGECEEPWGSNLGQCVVKNCFRNTSISRFSSNRPHYIFQMQKQYWCWHRDQECVGLPIADFHFIELGIYHVEWEIKYKDTWTQVETCAMSLQSPCPNKGVLVHFGNQGPSEKAGRKEQLHFLTFKCQRHLRLAFKLSIFYWAFFLQKDLMSHLNQ